MKREPTFVADYEDWKTHLPTEIEARVLAIMRRYCNKVGCCHERIIRQLCRGNSPEETLAQLKRRKIASVASVVQETSGKDRIWTLLK